MRLATEIVDHAVGKVLETETQRRCREAARVVEIERGGDLATVLAAGQECPLAFQRAEWSIEKMHVQTLRAHERIACRETLGDSSQTYIEACRKRVFIAVENRRAGTPWKP